MSEFGTTSLSASALRREVLARGLKHAAEGHLHETGSGATPTVLYAPDDEGQHGNFLPAAYRRILADPSWRTRLSKAYTSQARIPRRHDRRRYELDCAASSDALLMNLFCYPGFTCRPEVCALLGIDRGGRPEFGVRAMLPMHRGEVDRTEIDLRCGSLLCEAKLTEGGFGTAAESRLRRYLAVEECLDVEALPRTGTAVLGWQLIRGVLAAHHAGGRFVVLCDARRGDLEELWMRVLSCVPASELRSRLGLVTWQELVAAAPPVLRRFLAAKYGILGR